MRRRFAGSDGASRPCAGCPDSRADSVGRAMLTLDEIARITIFSSLSREELERICRAAADITLMAGEDAAPQGSERALFGLLEGRIDVIQLTDGVERLVGVREPGDIFGEVP